MEGGGLSDTTAVASSVTGSAEAGPVADTLSVHISARKSDMRILYGKLLYFMIDRPMQIAHRLFRPFWQGSSKECELSYKPPAELHDMPSRKPVPAKRATPAYIGFHTYKNVLVSREVT